MKGMMMKPQDDGETKSPTIYQSLNDLVIALNNSDADKTTSIMIMENLIRDIISVNIPLDQRWSTTNGVEKYVKKIASGDLRYASGFNGHWAKWHEEQFENETD
jgi:uncharacterized protein YejL (UPF0352 family)